ncbi:carboxylic acid reductase [Mycobacterium sp.]|uniref:carboxylic acid reductase n=1 Tax=Mycobacterium sp. TaxID=1785 RepID=UPI002D8B8AD9|nr:carboxylic acid reductase [Mycobacterium sp.]
MSARPSDRGDRVTRRIASLSVTDRQFASAKPDPQVSRLIDPPHVRLTEIVQIVLERYADRPALGQRIVDYRTDPDTSRTTADLVPRFEVITYRELSARSRAVADGLVAGGVRAGDRVATLGFNSVEYTVLDLAIVQIGAVAVPLPIGAPAAHLQLIVAETEPMLIACSTEYLDDAIQFVGSAPGAAGRLLVFDFHQACDDHRDALDAVRLRLSGSMTNVDVQTLAEVQTRGLGQPRTQSRVPDESDPLSLLVYTSGSSGTPKGAMHPASLVANAWRPSSRAAWGHPSDAPMITLSFLPMSHMSGRGLLYSTLGSGGTAYFAANSDLSTILDDLALVRPTQLDFVPRMWDVLYDEFISEVDRRCGAADRAEVEADVLADIRRSRLGARYLSVMTGSAPTSARVRAWAESLLDMHLSEGYGSTETGVILVDGRVRRPPVTDYKLVDVPELGYFHTDRPNPRGELLVKSNAVIPGYYKRPDATAEMFDEDGYYRTGDIVAEEGPDQLRYIDRRNNIIKLSQGEFVAVSKVEAVFGATTHVRQIYIHGDSSRPYLLAVVVPTEESLDDNDMASLRALIHASMVEAARAAGLRAHEVPRDFIIDTAPFTTQNGLLTSVGKPALAELRAHYGPALDRHYTDLAEKDASELRELRRNGAERSVFETVRRAAGTLLGVPASDLRIDEPFYAIGGDSLSGLAFSNLLRQIYDIDVGVNVILGPAASLRSLVAYIEARRQSVPARPSFASVHGKAVTQVHARDLTLDKFLDETTIAGAPELPGPTDRLNTVLLTGATGFLGRFLALELLERMAQVDGKVICLVRASDNAAARRRLDATFRGGPNLLQCFEELAAGRLEVLSGDKIEPELGLEKSTWQRLAETVDLIVDPAAMVNHVLPYSQLFAPNTIGTAELIRLALTTRIKPFAYVSTAGVGAGLDAREFNEDNDIRRISGSRIVDDSYANGYVNSKWASEVLLRESYDLCGLPVAVFRCDMISAHPHFAGQLNLADTFTRVMLSVLATGIAPKSFYVPDADGNRQRADHAGLPVDFVAKAISTIGGSSLNGFNTFHVVNPHRDGIGMDEYVDWLIDAGHSIARIDDYAEWLRRFETSLRGLPDLPRQASLLPLLRNYQRPANPQRAPIAPTDRFRAAVRSAKIGPDGEIPHVLARDIAKYVSDLKLLGLT